MNIILPEQKRDMPDEKLRLDKYLWAIRLFKTRSLASDACEKRQGQVPGQCLQTFQHVHIDEEYEVKTEQKKMAYQSNGDPPQPGTIQRSIKFYLDITPAEEIERIQFQAATFHTGKRLSKQGAQPKGQKGY